MYHGAALIQIAEHPKFTAINSFKYKKTVYKNAYTINNDSTLYLKYASKPKRPHNEYGFNFTNENLEELKKINKKAQKLYLGLVLVDDREICCLKYKELKRLIRSRKNILKKDEEQYTVLITAEAKKQLRAYINKPNVKNERTSVLLVIKRNDFPKALFDKNN